MQATPQYVSFDRAADYYDETRGFPPGVEQQAVNLFVEAGNLTNRSRVLEIGVGTGRIALPLAPKVETYIGLDISLAMMQRLRQKKGGEQITLIEGNAAHLPFATHSLDAVIAVHVFHLIPNYPDVLQEIARVLRPGAMLLHGWNDRGSENSLERTWRDAISHFHDVSRGISWEKRQAFLPEAGWRAIGPELRHLYVTERSPLTYVQHLRERKWSQTWRMTDEQIAEGIAAVEAFIADNHIDPTIPNQVEATFNVQAFLPPQ
ncbi:MAG: class I SAM-dependent methyltransferase [Chloroflexi bacterium]|nr:class I SAM-dependent methyltransferase [Chloroflexota bacterium]